MATLEHLAATDKLISHDPDLENDEFPERFAYFAPDFDDWLAQTLAGLGRRHGRNRTPHEQAEQILYDFIIGRRLAYGSSYHPLDPLASHVWEFKTPDIRLFGWFPRRRHFVIVCGELKDNLKKRADYAPYIAGVVAFRDGLDLDEPKAVTGVRQDEVL
jgi:hypothetical protein